MAVILIHGHCLEFSSLKQLYTFNNWRREGEGPIFKTHTSIALDRAPLSHTLKLICLRFNAVFPPFENLDNLDRSLRNRCVKFSEWTPSLTEVRLTSTVLYQSKYVTTLSHRRDVGTEQVIQWYKYSVYSTVSDRHRRYELYRVVQMDRVT